MQFDFLNNISVNIPTNYILHRVILTMGGFVELRLTEEHTEKGGVKP